jgi:hypothetical protein
MAKASPDTIPTRTVPMTGKLIPISDVPMKPRKLGSPDSRSIASHSLFGVAPALPYTPDLRFTPSPAPPPMHALRLLGERFCYALTRLSAPGQGVREGIAVVQPLGRSYNVSYHIRRHQGCKRGAAMRMESPDDYTRWIERAARRLEEAMRNDDVKQAEAEMKLIERTLKVLRQKFAEHMANMK